MADREQKVERDPLLEAAIDAAHDPYHDAVCEICKNNDPGYDPYAMICDRCDRVYHSFCLKLDAVPRDDVWFCDECHLVIGSSIYDARALSDHIKLDRLEQGLQSMESTINSLNELNESNHSNPRQRLRINNVQNDDDSDSNFLNDIEPDIESDIESDSESESQDLEEWIPQKDLREQQRLKREQERERQRRDMEYGNLFDFGVIAVDHSHSEREKIRKKKRRRSSTYESLRKTDGHHDNRAVGRTRKRKRKRENERNVNGNGAGGLLREFEKKWTSQTDHEMLQTVKTERKKKRRRLNEDELLESPDSGDTVLSVPRLSEGNVCMESIERKECVAKKDEVISLQKEGVKTVIDRDGNEICEFTLLKRKRRKKGQKSLSTCPTNSSFSGLDLLLQYTEKVES